MICLDVIVWQCRENNLQLFNEVLFRWGWDNSVSIATRYGLDGLGIKSRWWARFSAPVQTGPGVTASCTKGAGSFLAVKWVGRGVDHPPPFSAKVKERVELYLCSPSEPSWPVLGRTLLYCVDATHENMASVQNFGAISCKFDANRIYLHNECLSKVVCDGGGDL